MANEPLQQGPYPAASNAFTVDTDIKAVVQWAAAKAVMTFASAAARTSAFSAAAVSPAAGMVCYRSDAPGLNKHETYDSASGAWKVFGPYRDCVTVTGSAAATVTLPSIPTYLRSLRVSVRARSTTAALFTGLTLQVAGDATNSYNSVKTYIQNSTATNGIIAANTATSADVGYLPGSTAGAGRFGNVVIDIAGWDNPTASSLSIKHDGGFCDVAITNTLLSRGECLYFGSSAYTSLVFAGGAALAVGTEIHVVGWW